MISALHLIWIIPVCAFVGMLVVTFFMGTTIHNNEYDAYHEGIKEGMRRAKDVKSLTFPDVKTLEEVYNTVCCSDFNKFTQMTDNIIYLCHTSGQLEMLYIDDVDLLFQYFDYFVVDIIEESTYNKLIIKQN